MMPHEYAWYMLKLYFMYYKAAVLVYALVYILPITLTLYGAKLWLRRKHTNKSHNTL